MICPVISSLYLLFISSSQLGTIFLPQAGLRDVHKSAMHQLLLGGRRVGLEPDIAFVANPLCCNCKTLALVKWTRML